MPHWINDALGIVTTIVLAFSAYQKLVRKDEIRTATDTIVDKVEEIGTALKVHVAEDLGKHFAIDQHLVYTDKRVDRLETERMKS